MAEAGIRSVVGLLAISICSCGTAANGPSDTASRGNDAALVATPFDAHSPYWAITPVDAVQTPVDAAQTPVDTAQAPADVAQTPVDAAQTPVDAAQRPVANDASPPTCPRSPTGQTLTFNGSTGCADGFCIWLRGCNLIDSNTSPSPATQEHSTYIDIYERRNTARVKRIYSHELTRRDKSATGGEDLITFKLGDAFLEKRFRKQGLLVQVVNPENSSASSRVLFEWQRNRVVISEDFDSVALGPYSTAELRTRFYRDRFGSLSPSATNNSSIVAFVSPHWGRDRGLEAYTDAGQFGPLRPSSGGGITFTVTFCGQAWCTKTTSPFSHGTETKGYEELYLSYRVNFATCSDGSAFDFHLGGKLPGLGGGHTVVASGGGHNGVSPNGYNAWSARAMFSPHESNPNAGKISSYMYHPDMLSTDPNLPHPRTGPVASHKYGQGFLWRDPVTRKAFIFLKNTWYRIQVRIKMNSIQSNTGLGRFDGIKEVRIDNATVLKLDQLRFRHGSFDTQADSSVAPYDVPKLLDIDALMFHHFFGGGTLDWAPRRKSCAQFDDVFVFAPHK